MPTTPARIGFITEQFRRVVSTTDEARTLFGSAARESDDPMQTYFGDVDDAQAVADERQALLSPARRRFEVQTVGLEEALTLDFTTGVIPNGRLIDPEKQADLPVLLAEVELDFARQKATLMVWG